MRQSPPKVTIRSGRCISIASRAARACRMRAPRPRMPFSSFRVSPDFGSGTGTVSTGPSGAELARQAVSIRNSNRAYFRPATAAYAAVGLSVLRGHVASCFDALGCPGPGKLVGHLSSPHNSPPSEAITTGICIGRHRKARPSHCHFCNGSGAESLTRSKSGLHDLRLRTSISAVKISLSGQQPKWKTATRKMAQSDLKNVSL
jgi:hypothetical protein